MIVKSLDDLSAEEYARLIKREESPISLTQIQSIVTSFRHQPPSVIKVDVQSTGGETLLEPLRAVYEKQLKAALKLTECATQALLHCDIPGTRFELVPYRRVGAYVPSQLPSTLVTIAANALGSGVKEMVIVTKDPPSSAFLSAARIANISEVYAMQSAKLAPLALGFGIEGILNPVDIVVGPCSPFVDAIKQVLPLYGVAVDIRANTSELIAYVEYKDSSTIPAKKIMADVLAQAEHSLDSKPRCFVLTPNREMACTLFNAGLELSKDLEYKGNVMILYGTSSIKFMNQYRPELLTIWTDDKELSQGICDDTQIGKVYVNTPSVLGDYGIVGTGCCDPTGGIAQSGISALTFLRLRSVMQYTPNQQDILYGSRIAQSEQLPNHNRAIVEAL